MSKVLELKGQIFGRLLVLKRDENHVYPNGIQTSKWICECDCGNIVSVLGKSLVSGVTQSCGCYNREISSKNKKLDLIGEKFGRLTVIDFDKMDTSSYWICECECGNNVSVRGSSLLSGHTKSCGCLTLESRIKVGKNNFNDLTGKTYGFLKVLNFEKFSYHGESIWNCLCECGNKTSVLAGALNSGKTKSCGCLSESYIASELKRYFSENYNAQLEYKLFKNPDTNQWFKCDIYIPKNIYIEVHGEQHYKLNGWHNLMAKRYNTSPEEEFEYQKYKDKLKKKFCKKNGTYIEINLLKIKTTEEAIEYIENILSKL